MTLWHFQLGRSQGGWAPVQRALLGCGHLPTCNRCHFSLLSSHEDQEVLKAWHQLKLKNIHFAGHVPEERKLFLV